MDKDEKPFQNVDKILKKKEAIALSAKKHTNRMIWIGLGALCVQVRCLASHLLASLSAAKSLSFTRPAF
jgi:hypothetical protein